MTQKSYVDDNPKYWAGYTNLQRVKHKLIREYLNGWLPKLGYWAGRIVYIDTHAGRGKHDQGELGSPLVALDTFLEHNHLKQILKRSEVVFWFIERDEENLKSLNKEIAKRGDLPLGMKVHSQSGNCFPILRKLIESLQAEGSQLAPAFIFVDPYGFGVPGSVLRELMQFQRVELFFNVIWRELNMALVQGNTNLGMANSLDSIFNGPHWRHKITSNDIDLRVGQTIDTFKEMLGAKWVTPIHMLGNNEKTRYVLAHFTNHNHGRDLMKDCVWKVCPDGKFRVRKFDNPHQLMLFSEGPDWNSLNQWVCEQLHERPHRWKEFHELVRPLIWRVPHVNKAISGLRKNKVILASEYEGRCTPNANPQLSLVQ
ncbi:MAG: three-Cys-motif partner protein TcmP [Candidatus Poribacteria bacterium]|nr:three-Cys-motif partner protein TcmP [Candidatus Poribacteria bacterium]